MKVTETLDLIVYGRVAFRATWLVRELAGSSRIEQCFSNIDCTRIVGSLTASEVSCGNTGENGSR